MSSIAELIGEISTTTATLRGKTVVLRPVPARTAALLRQAFPIPIPPKVPDPMSGTNSGRFINDECDPGYIRAHSEWARKLMYIEVAASMDLEPKGTQRSAQAITTVEDMRSWAELAHAEILVLTDIELQHLGRAIDRISLSSVEEAAKKG
jgi:hypothetical protein